MNASDTAAGPLVRRTIGRGLLFQWPPQYIEAFIAHNMSHADSICL